MKKTWKLIVTLACIAALVMSLGVGAFAKSDIDLEEVAAMAQKACDQQEIQNVMSWHVM